MKGKIFMKKVNTFKLTLTAIFTAIIIVMSFTPLGYLKVGVIEITFTTIPVALGAMIAGPAVGAFLGFAFGMTSFIQCFGFSAFGAALLGINPIFTAIVCLVPRILMGWLTGLIFKGLRSKCSKPLVANFVGGIVAPLLNTLFFMSALILLFWNTEFIQSLASGMNILAFVVAFVGINGLIEAVVAAIINIPASRALEKGFRRYLKDIK